MAAVLILSASFRASWMSTAALFERPVGMLVGMGAAQTAGQAAPSASLMPGLRAPKLRSHPAENAPHATRRGHGSQTRQGVWRGSGRPGSAVHRRDVQLRISFVLLQIHKTISALIEAQTNLFALFFFF